MTAIPREALWSAALLRRFSPFRRFAASTLQRFNVSTPQRERASAFTLLELLIVVGIIALLLVLLAPAFTTIKGGTDVTSAAYTIKGVLDTARTYTRRQTILTLGLALRKLMFLEILLPALKSMAPAVWRLQLSHPRMERAGMMLPTPAYQALHGPTIIMAANLDAVGKLQYLENAHLAGALANTGNMARPASHQIITLLASPQHL